MSTPKSKRGCRPLLIAEVIKPGDFTWFASQWQPVESFCNVVGKKIGAYSYRCCRPVPKRQLAVEREIAATVRRMKGGRR